MPPGEIATLFFDVEEASACNSIAGAGSLSWEYRSRDGEWRPLDVIDGRERIAAQPRDRCQRPQDDRERHTHARLDA